MTTVTSIAREHRIPIPVDRKGCACKMAPIYQATLPTEDRTALIQQFTTMKLAHLSKDGVEKNSLKLDKIHHQLKMDALTLNNSGASNILVASVSFDCLIECLPLETKKTDNLIRKSKEEKLTKRDYLTFDLKIPCINETGDTVFCYDNLEKMYGGKENGKENLYQALKYFYGVGRKIANPKGCQHGHKPKYDANFSAHDQYIRHTEQMLVAYLVRPRAARMLHNRLQTEIREKYSDATSVKVYNMGLHMHSTKTCCAPCEYTLLGLMNSSTGILQDSYQLSFIHNFQRFCSEPNQPLTFFFPQKSSFKLVVTVTAEETDAHHRSAPLYKIKKLKQKRSIPSRTISVKDPSVSKTIFTTLFTEKYDVRRKPDTSSLADRTVAISGSLKTDGSPETINKVKEVIAVDDNTMNEIFLLSPLFA